MKRLLIAFALISGFIPVYGQSRQLAHELPVIKKLNGNISWADAMHMRGNARQGSAQNIIIDPLTYDAIITDDWGGVFEDNNFINLNTNFSDADTSLRFAMTWATQAFDTLFDINTFIGYPYINTPVHLDSVDIVIAHENLTGTSDTIVFSVYAYQAQYGIQVDFQAPANPLTNTVLYSDTVVTTTSLSPSGQYSLYTIHPDIDIQGNKKFLVGVHFYGSTQNTFGLRAGYADRCGSCVAYPSVNEDNTAYRMVHWQAPPGQAAQDLTNVYTNYSFGLSYDCSQNGVFGERDECEYMFIQNFWMTAYVTIVPALSASISGSTSFCSGNSTLLTAQTTGSSGFISYAWSTSDTAQNIFVSSAGVYSVTVFDQNSTASASVNVTEVTCLSGCTALPSLTPSSCTPLILPGPGFSDTSLCVVQGEAANTSVSFQNFSSISGITVEWIRIDSLTNMPCGLTFAMNDPDNTLITSENGCLNFSGTTSAAAGVYDLGIWVTIKISILPNPLSGEAGTLSAQFGGPAFGFRVIVNNPGESCSGVTEVTVSGSIASETGSSVNAVIVTATGGASPSDMTDSIGSYTLTFNSGDSAVVTPSKSNDVSTNNGNSTLDILLVRRHLLAIQALNTPYKIIAGDVNGSGSVTTTDILFIRSMILQIITTFPNGKLWAFVPDDFVFANPQNPFPFTSSRTYNNLNSDMTEQNFIGIKLGDVNNDWNPNVAKASAIGEVQFMMDEQYALQEQEIIVPVKVKDFRNVTGYQFTLSWDAEVLELVDVNNESINSYYGMQRHQEGFLTTSWDDNMAKGVSLNDDETAFELKFRVIGENGTFSEIKISSELTASEAYNENLDLLSIQSSNGMLKVGDAIVNPQSPIINLQVKPNPFTNSTNISFSIPENEVVTVSIYDALGRAVKSFHAMYKAGNNSLIWTGEDDSGSGLNRGLYLIRLTTGSQIASCKAVLIR